MALLQQSTGAPDLLEEQLWLQVQTEEILMR
jgi:hypothetical protein